jgi:transposase-like protein
VLVELGVVEQRYDAVKEVLDGGGTVTEVAERYSVTRQSLHNWLRRYRERGMAGLVDRSKRPRTCPHRTPARSEIRVIELRREHPRWGPRRLAYELARKHLDPVPSRSSIYRILARSGLVQPRAQRRKRSDYIRWERARPMELHQMLTPAPGLLSWPRRPWGGGRDCAGGAGGRGGTLRRGEAECPTRGL